MGMIRFAIENPVKVAVGVILIVLFGLLSATRMSIQLTPDVDRPVIVVKTFWQGASPQEIEAEIVDRQEEKLKNVDGLLKMTSSSSTNNAEIKLEFAVGVDKDRAFRNVSDKLRQVSGYPEEVDQPTMVATDAVMAKTIAWIMFYSKGGEDVAPLKKFVEDNVKPMLERAEGISQVDVYGGREREIQIEIDPYRLAARGITVRDVEEALRRQNDNISAGTIYLGKRDYNYRTVGEFTKIEQIEETVVAYQPGGPVRVRDVAVTIDDYKKPVSFVRSKGRKVLALPARRETGANIIQAMENLKRQIGIVNREILEPRGLGLELTQVYDETTYIWSSIGLVVKNIFFGGFLAIAVLLLFLRSGSATGIVAAAIPISVVGTLLVINLLDRSLNVILLAGMAFAVGMVVDNAIVVLENIYRHRGMGKNRLQAALDGAREVWGAILASTLTTMAVFLPVITIHEEAGQLFKDIAIAIASAVGLSLVVSVLVIPPLAARFFSASRATRSDGKTWWLATWLSVAVAAINRRVSTRVAVVAGLSLAAIVGSYRLMPATEYLPAGNKNLVFGFLFSPPGYSIEEFRRMATLVEEGDPQDPLDGVRPYWEAELGSPEIARLPAVDIKLGMKGEITRQVPAEPIENFFFVSFGGGAFMGATSKDPTRVKPVQSILTRTGQRVAGVFTMFHQASLFGSGSLRGGNSIDIDVRGDDLDAVVESALALRMQIQKTGYRWPAATPPNFDLGSPEVRMIPDRAKAADLDLNVRDVGFIVRACVDGAFVGEFNDHGDKIDLVLTMADTESATPTEIGQIPIYTPTGHVVPLSSAVRFQRTTAPQQIRRIEEMSGVTLSVPPKPGVPLQASMDELTNSVIAPLRESGAIPPTVITSLAGTADKLTQTQRALVGDFRNTVNNPQILGMGVGKSVIAIVLAGMVLALGASLLAGARAGVTVFGALAAAGIIAFLAVNPGFCLMLFQSRGVLALVVIYLLMAALFESFAYPLVIMFSVPLAAVGGFAALSIVHEVSLYDVTSPIQQLDVLTMLGFVILIGIVVNNAILLVHQALYNMREGGMEAPEAIAASVQTRTRPIFMSALTSVFGMFPLVIMPGAGSELYRGLGSVVLGGLLVSTVFTLFVVPASFSLALSFQRWYATASRQREPDVVPGGARAPVPAPRSAE